MTTTKRVWFLCLLVYNVSFLQAFVRRPHSMVGRPESSPSSSRISVQGTAKTAAEPESLTFACDLTFTSDPIPGVKLEEMANYLKTEECRRLLLSAGGTRKAERLPPTLDLQAMWEEAAEYFPNVPERGEEYMSTDTMIKFPSIKVKNTVVNGATQVQDERGLPKYVFLLVGERRTATGPKPLVWLFEKITGAAKSSAEDGYKKPKAHVITYCSVVDDNNNRGPVFQVDVSFKVIVEFPKSLLRVLPASKAKMEEQGSAACAKAVSGDVNIAIKSIRDAFSKWQQESLVATSK